MLNWFSFLSLGFFIGLRFVRLNFFLSLLGRGSLDGNLNVLVSFKDGLHDLEVFSGENGNSISFIILEGELEGS